MDGGAWWAALHGVAKSRTVLSDFTFTFDFHALKKDMEAHSSVRAWRIPGTAEPGGLPSVVLHRVGHDWRLNSSSGDPIGFPGGTNGKEPTCQCRRLKPVWSLGWEDPLEESMATHSSILAWKFPWTEEPGRLQSMRLTNGWTQLKWLSIHAHRDPKHLFENLTFYFLSLF